MFFSHFPGFRRLNLAPGFNLTSHFCFPAFHTSRMDFLYKIHIYWKASVFLGGLNRSSCKRSLEKRSYLATHILELSACGVVMLLRWLNKRGERLRREEDRKPAHLVCFYWWNKTYFNSDLKLTLAYQNIQSIRQKYLIKWRMDFVAMCAEAMLLRLVLFSKEHWVNSSSYTIDLTPHSAHPWTVICICSKLNCNRALIHCFDTAGDMMYEKSRSPDNNQPTTY